jgi:hypothetical protein
MPHLRQVLIKLVNVWLATNLRRDSFGLHIIRVKRFGFKIFCHTFCSLPHLPKTKCENAFICATKVGDDESIPVY